LGDVVAHIPARAGSKRVPSKNLRYLGGEPLISYAIRAALGSKSLSSIYVNSDSDEILALGEKLGALVYRRRSGLASDDATSDHFNMDIIEALRPDTLVMINPVCPLIESVDIDAAMDVYGNGSFDTLITTTATQLQCFHQDRSVNVNLDEPLARTQDNDEVHVCNWAITIWDAEKFRDRYNRRGFAAFGDNRKLLAISPLKAIKISTEEDFRVAESLVRAFRTGKDLKPETRYWSEERLGSY
jgi:CMP-N-acetylneuraminic acid synthetase